jgi:hypothetical protein
MKTSYPTPPVLGRAEPFDYEDRYFLQNAEKAMGNDIVRGLVELITNADESYARLEDGGRQVSGEIRVFVERRRGAPSIVEVLDFAEGMHLEEMVSKLKRIGGKTSGFIENKGKRRRGLMGRGSKECVAFGDVRFRSIKEGRYSEIRLQRRPASFVPIADRDATAVDRVELEIPRGNGTRVTIEVLSKYRIPTHEILLRDLPRHYSLRDIASSTGRKLFLIDLGKRKGNKSSLQYSSKEGETVLDEVFHVLGYPREAEAHLIIKRARERIKAEPDSPYWEGGVLVRSNYTIHGVTAFHRDVGSNPYFENFFGSLECKFIDDLQIDYEQKEGNGQAHTPENPVRVIDPTRSGLSKDHPFTNALNKECAQRLKELLKREEEAARHQQKTIENKRTTERLKKLAGEMSKFIKDHTETIEDLDEEYLDSSEIPTGGMRIVPGGARVVLMEERRFYIYVRPTAQQGERHVMLSVDSQAIQLSADRLTLIERGNGILTNSFSVRGLKENESANVRVAWGQIEKTLQVQVIRPENIAVQIPEFSFEKTAYTVKEGKKKDIRILAKWPEFVHGEVTVNLSASNDSAFEILSKNVKLKYEQLGGRKAAIGTVRILGKVAGVPATLKTSLQGREISTKIKVIPEEPMGKDFRIEVVDEDLGNQRATWDGNRLKISGRHESIRRYLGPPEADPPFPGQESLHFRLLVAELVAYNAARRILELNAPKDTRTFENIDVTGFYRKHAEYVNDFLPIAHRCQVPKSELEKGQ